jgi:ferredoxin
MKVTINTALCQGHGRCTLIAPEVFDIDDDGFGMVIRNPDPSEEDDVRKAVSSCPESAITVD